MQLSADRRGPRSPCILLIIITPRLFEICLGYAYARCMRVAGGHVRTCMHIMTLHACSMHLHHDGDVHSCVQLPFKAAAEVHNFAGQHRQSAASA